MREIQNFIFPSSSSGSGSGSSKEEGSFFNFWPFNLFNSTDTRKKVDSNLLDSTDPLMLLAVLGGLVGVGYAASISIKKKIRKDKKKNRKVNRKRKLKGYRKRKLKGYRVVLKIKNKKKKK